MTTHENTAGQYRRAPLNGLAIEAIVGAVWVLVFLGVYLKTHDDFTYINVALMCFVFPIIGWLTGLWERSACAYKTPTKQTRKIATIGAVMTTITGLIMATVCYAILDKPEDHGILKNAAFSGKTFIVYFAPLIVFPIAGYALGVFRSVLAFEDRFIIFKMSLASITALFACVITWLCFSGILGMVFFFTF